jgi:amino acid transporter
VYAELAPMMPTAGGDRDYIHAAFGRSVSFAYSLSMFLVIKPGALAILALTFAQYASAAVSPGVDDTGLVVKAIGATSLCANHIHPHIHMLSPCYHSDPPLFPALHTRHIHT